MNAAHGRHEKEKRPSVLTFTPNTDTFTFLCATGFIRTILTFLQSNHIMLTSNVNDISYREEEVMVVELQARRL